MICWVLETVRNQMNFTQEGKMKIKTSFTFVSAILVYRDKSLEITVKINLFTQPLRDFGSMYKDIGCYDMNYDEFIEIIREAWTENFNNLCIDD